ncbi:hypothetical protein MKX01_016872 [Papaver californicum]|nr:hypothetical protein MKX01_016872 [Papaver californicum]
MAEKTPNHHVVVMAFQYGTHAITLFNLVRRLAVQAPALTFSFFSTVKANQSVFGSKSTSYNNLPNNTNFFLKSMAEIFGNRIGSVYGHESSDNIKCFIKGVPWISFWTAGPCSLSTHYYTDLIRQTISLDLIVFKDFFFTSLICRPFFGDQRVNCRMVSDVWWIGTRVRDGVFTKDGTMEWLDMIFSDEKLREKIGALRGFAKHAAKNFNTLAEIVL